MTGDLLRVLVVLVVLCLAGRYLMYDTVLARYIFDDLHLTLLHAVAFTAIDVRAWTSSLGSLLPLLSLESTMRLPHKNRVVHT